MTQTPIMETSISSAYSNTVRTVHASNQIFGLFGLDIERYAALATLVEGGSPRSPESLEENLLLPRKNVETIVGDLKGRNLVEETGGGLLISTIMGATLLSAIAGVLAVTLNQGAMP